MSLSAEFKRKFNDLELILEEVEINNSFITDEDEYTVYIDNSVDSKTFYAVNKNFIHRFRLNSRQSLINFGNSKRDAILNYRLAVVNDDDEVSAGDIFMYGNMIQLVDSVDLLVTETIYNHVDEDGNEIDISLRNENDFIFSVNDETIVLKRSHAFNIISKLSGVAYRK